MKGADPVGLQIREAGARCLQDAGDRKERLRSLSRRLEELSAELERTGAVHPWPEALSALSPAPEEKILLCLLWSLEGPGGGSEEELRLFLEELGVAPLPYWTVLQGGRVRLSPVVSAWLDGRPPALPEGAELRFPRERRFRGSVELLRTGRKFLAYAEQEEGAAVLCVRGKKGSGRKTYIEQLFRAEGLAVLILEGAVLAGTKEELEDCMLCARLYAAAVCVCADETAGRRLLRRVSGCFRFCAAVLEDGCTPESDLDLDADTLIFDQKLSEPEPECRFRMAREVLGEATKLLPAGFSPERLVREREPAGVCLRRLERVRAELLCDCFHPENACRERASEVLCPLPADRTLEELKLPAFQYERLIRICRMAAVREEVLEQWGFGEKFSYGNGFSVLFYGAPGTGKTMAAQALAHELKKPLYRVDLSQLTSKYIGETQKNIGRIFDEAEGLDCILFFDEADAVFARRSEVSDAQDRYSNGETAYLLQRMEQYAGVSILATNLLQNFDDAFRRRISCMVHFPMPDAALRRELWEEIFPADTPVSPEVDASVLAESFELSGASIRSAAWHGALLARSEGCGVQMRHILSGIENEYSRQGKTFPGELFAQNGFKTGG